MSDTRYWAGVAITDNLSHKEGCDCDADGCQIQVSIARYGTQVQPEHVELMVDGVTVQITPGDLERAATSANNIMRKFKERAAAINAALRDEAD